MAILQESDQPTYFPEVTATGPALNGYISFAQALCESHWGANRPLELREHTDLVLMPSHEWGRLPNWPIVSISTLELRTIPRSGWLRNLGSTWLTIDPASYSYDPITGRFELTGHLATEARATYTAGFNFTVPSDEVKAIKSIAGSVVDWAARRYYGQLDSYLLNPGNKDLDVESWNYQRIDIWLQEILRPLRYYSAHAV